MTVIDTIPHYDFGDGTMWLGAGFGLNTGQPNYVSVSDGMYVILNPNVSLVEAMRIKGLRYIRVLLPPAGTPAGDQLPNILQSALVGVYPNGRIEPLFTGGYPDKDTTHEMYGWALSDVLKHVGTWTHEGNCYVTSVPYADYIPPTNFVPWSLAGQVDAYISMGWIKPDPAVPVFTQAPNGLWQMLLSSWNADTGTSVGMWVPMPGGLQGAQQVEFCRAYQMPDKGTFLTNYGPAIIFGLMVGGIASVVSSAASAGAADAGTALVDAGASDAAFDIGAGDIGVGAGDALDVGSGGFDIGSGDIGVGAGDALDAGSGGIDASVTSKGGTSLVDTATNYLTNYGKNFGKDLVLQNLSDSQGGYFRYGIYTSLTPSQPKGATQPVAPEKGIMDSLKMALTVFTLLELFTR